MRDIVVLQGGERSVDSRQVRTAGIRGRRSLQRHRLTSGYYSAHYYLLAWIMLVTVLRCRLQCYSASYSGICNLLCDSFWRGSICNPKFMGHCQTVDLCYSVAVQVTVLQCRLWWPLTHYIHIHLPGYSGSTRELSKLMSERFLPIYAAMHRIDVDIGKIQQGNPLAWAVGWQ